MSKDYEPAVVIVGDTLHVGDLAAPLPDVIEELERRLAVPPSLTLVEGRRDDR